VSDALAALQKAGLTGRVEGEGDAVAAQLPHAGYAVAGGSTVILSTTGELVPRFETVPDVTGLLYSQARELLADRGLYLHADSTILADSDTVRVAFQSVEAGTQTLQGTVLAVTLVNENDEDYGRY
jgi:beta-lactam-binding protein with PASTA domain